MHERPGIGCKMALRCVFLLSMLAVSVQAGDGTWTNATDGSWSVAGNWASNNVASGAGSTAFFTNATGVIVNQDDPALTLGGLCFSNGNYVISNNAIALSGGNTITVGTNSASAITSVISGNGLFKLGDGLLTLGAANTLSGTLGINAGTLSLTGTFAGNSVSFGSNSIPGGSLIVGNPAALSSVTNILIHGGAITLAIDSALSNSTSMTIVRTVWNDGPISLVVDRATPGDGVNHTFGVLSPWDKGIVTVSCGSNTCGTAPFVTFNSVTNFGSFNNAVIGRIIPLGVNLRLGDMVPMAATVTDSFIQRFELDGTSTDNQITGTISDNDNNHGVYTNWTSIVKQNTSTWILRGTNTYTGATRVSGGKLVGVTGGSCSSSTVTVDNVTGILGVLVTDNTQQWTCAALTFSAAGRLDFDFGKSVRPGVTVGPLQVTNNVTFTVTPVVTVSGGTNLTAGDYPLMTWTSRSGTVPTNAVLPPHVSGGILTISNTTLNLNIITNTMPLTWTNSGVGTWDTASFSWKDSAGNSEKYQETTVSGDIVIFDDAPGAGSSTVTLNTAVAPANVTINNTNRNYTVTGTGRITGVTGLTKNGIGTFTLSTTNDYSGVTMINGGTLAIAGSGYLYGGAGRGSITNNGLFVYGSMVTQTFYSAMAGTGSVICTGSGTLIFAAASTYTGDTKVYGGTVQVNQPSLASVGDVYMYTGGKLKLNFNGTNTIRYLHINGWIVSRGTYGATGSGAQVIRDDFFSGSGVLNVSRGDPGMVIRVR